MTTITKKPTITTPFGNTLTVTPGTEKPLSVDEWFKWLEGWRERNRDCVENISVEEFLADKRAENEKEFL